MDEEVKRRADEARRFVKWAAIQPRAWRKGNKEYPQQLYEAVCAQIPDLEQRLESLKRNERTLEQQHTSLQEIERELVSESENIAAELNPVRRKRAETESALKRLERAGKWAILPSLIPRLKVELESRRSARKRELEMQRQTEHRLEGASERIGSGLEEIRHSQAKVNEALAQTRRAIEEVHEALTSARMLRDAGRP